MRYAVPAVFLLVGIGATYEHYHPWQPAGTVLPDAQSNSRVLVGFNIHHAGDNAEYTMTYAVFPGDTRRPTFYRLHQVDGGPFDVSIEPNGLLQFLLGSGVALLSCIIAWIAPTIPRVA